MIRLAEDTISQDELDAAAEFISSGSRLTKGEITEVFEAEFSKKLGAEYSVYVNSGSSANLLVAAALKESGRLKNHVVVCPAISWVTTVTPFMHLGFDVILCDSEPTTLGVDPVELEKIFQTSQPSLLVIVHVLGHPNNMEKITQLCEAYGVILIEDSCEALGTVDVSGAWLGSIGLAGTFSFYYGHHISTIEGGMVVTDDFEFFQLMLSLRSHGWSRDLDSSVREDLVTRYQTDSFRDLYTFYYPGFNFRSTDLQAFIGLGQVKKIVEIAQTRQENFFRYKSQLGNYWSQSSDSELLSSFAYGSVVSNREALARELLANGVESRPLICGNIGRHPFWLRHNSPQALPVADWIHDFGIYLPNHANLSHADIDIITDIVSSVGIPNFDSPSVDSW